MVRIKLEKFGAAQQGTAGPALLAGVDSDKSARVGAVLSAPGSLAKGALVVGGAVGDGVGNILTTGLTGVFSLGKGFRDFILRGTVVELAVAVVLGTAFTNLISAATSDWILPLIGAIFQGTRFTELYFTINYSQFNYGHFINEFLVFVLVCLILYLAVVVPLNKLQYAAFKHKAILRDCPRCLEEISMAATRCKHCCADIEVDGQVKAMLELAEAAMEAEEQKQHWCLKMLHCCVKPQTAVIESMPGGELQLKEVQTSSQEDVIGVPHAATYPGQLYCDISGSYASAAASASGASPPQQLSPAMPRGVSGSYGTTWPSPATAEPMLAMTSTPSASVPCPGIQIDIPGLKSQLKSNFQKHM